MAEQGRQFKSVWRKGEPAPEHVIDRAVKDIARERRQVSSDMISTLMMGKAPNNPVANAMLARTQPVDKMQGRPVSGAELSRVKHFVQAGLDYANRWHDPEIVPEGYFTEHPSDEGTPDYPKDIDWGDK
jgi:hypothetical protein